MEAILGGQKTVDIGEYERATPDGYAEDHELKKILCFDFLGCLVSNAGDNIASNEANGASSSSSRSTVTPSARNV